MLAKVTTKGQVTIPKKIRDALRIRPNDRIDFEREGGRLLWYPSRRLRIFVERLEEKLRAALKRNAPNLKRP